MHIQLIMFSSSTLILPMRFWRILQPNHIRDGAMLNASYGELDRFIAIFLKLLGQYLIQLCQTDLFLNFFEANFPSRYNQSTVCPLLSRLKNYSIFGIQTSFTQIDLHILGWRHN